VFVQFFLDEGLIEKDAEGCIKFAYNEHQLRYGHAPFFYTKADKWEWIVENGLFSFLKDKFLSDETIKTIFYVARYTESTIGINDGFIFHFYGPWIDYEKCWALPCLPPHNHEWVDDPWVALGK
jgi:hypothetical protein